MILQMKYSGILFFSFFLIAIHPVFATTIFDGKSIQELQKNKNEIQIEIDGKKKDLYEIEEDLNDLDRDILKFKTSIHKNEAEIKALDKSILENRSEMDDLNRQIFENQQRLGKRMRAMYKNSQLGYLEIIFSSKNLSEFINNLVISKKIIDYDKEIFRSLKLDSASLEAIRRDQEKKVRERHEKKLRLLDEKFDLEQERAFQKELEYRVDEELAKLYVQMDILEKEADQLKDKILLLQQGVNSGYKGYYENTAFTPGIHSIRWPLEGEGKLTSGYGYRMHPILNRLMFHSGIDIAAPKGTSVLAAGDGLVLFSSFQGSYGNVIFIAHSEELVTIYAHNSKNTVSAGQWVSSGEKIAEVGSTGRSTGPHLHFEVRIQGETTDPMRFFQ